MLGLKTPGLPDVSSATGAPEAPVPEPVDGIDRPSKEGSFLLLKKDRSYESYTGTMPYRTSKNDLFRKGGQGLSRLT